MPARNREMVATRVVVAGIVLDTLSRGDRLWQPGVGLPLSTAVIQAAQMLGYKASDSPLGMNSL